jgi:predicted RNase H-like nuclease (RuvC/YqgF family)
MSDRARPDEQYLDLPVDDGQAGEHIDNQVQRAQEQLLALKRQQDQIERQKRELEELGRRQEQLQQGKAEMVEKFTRSLVVLERENYDAQKRVETLHSIHQSFSQHLDIMEAINPKSWEGLDLNKELTKALSAVDDARAEYARSLPKITLEAEGADAVAAGAGYQADLGGLDAKDFTYWLKAGFAFTLPLLAVGVLLIIVLVAVFNR